MSELGFQSALAACTRSAQAQALRSESNVLWGRLNVLSRRDRLERSADVARLADCWLAFESIRRRIGKVEWKAETDPRVALMVREMRMIEDDLRRKLKSHAEDIGDYTCVLAPGQWARRILATHKAVGAKKAARGSQRRRSEAAPKRAQCPPAAADRARLPAKRSARKPALKRTPVLKRAGRREPASVTCSIEDVQDAVNGIMAASNPLVDRR